MDQSTSREAGQSSLDAWLGFNSRGVQARAERTNNGQPHAAPSATNNDLDARNNQQSLNNSAHNGRNNDHRDNTSNNGGHSRFRDNDTTTPQRAVLIATSKETRTVLPDILAQIPNIHASNSQALFLSTLPPLRSADCPRRIGGTKAVIKIVNMDTFNAAIELVSIPSSVLDGTQGTGRVAVLNMASHSRAGGGWLTGAMAQEEALCYRSSLALSLHKRYYPWKQRMGIYTPDVVIIRSDIPSGHKLYVPEIAPAHLPVVSVLSIAAPRCPEVRHIQVTTTTTATTPGMATQVVDRAVFKDPAVRTLVKDKMRLCLRMAASHGHRRLVLGALGCGAFRNPRREVAHCWEEVLGESEFAGGWWEEVWFAVYDRKNEGNFEVFEEILSGKEV